MFILEKRERERERERIRLSVNLPVDKVVGLIRCMVSDTDTELDLGFRGSPYVVSEKSPIPGHVPNCVHLNDRHTHMRVRHTIPSTNWTRPYLVVLIFV